MDLQTNQLVRNELNVKKNNLTKIRISYEPVKLDRVVPFRNSIFMKIEYPC